MSLSPALHVRQTLQHTATLVTTLQHTATHCNISWLPPHHRCNTLQHTHSNDYLLVVNETHGIMRVVGTPVLLCTSVCVCMTLRENTRERERTRVGRAKYTSFMIYYVHMCMCACVHVCVCVRRVFCVSICVYIYYIYVYVYIMSLSCVRPAIREDMSANSGSIYRFEHMLCA